MVFLHLIIDKEFILLDSINLKNCLISIKELSDVVIPLWKRGMKGGF